jgi:FkbM family methyltransferase
LLDKSLPIQEKYGYLLGLISLIRDIMLHDQYLIREYIKDDFTVIDAGSNIGVFSIFAHYVAPKAKIFAFEPVIKNFKILEKNIEGNGLFDKIKIFNVGLGEKKCEKQIMISNQPLATDSTFCDSDFCKNHDKKFTTSSMVQVLTLDDFIEDNEIDRVDFIKIDTEGYERQILNGAKKIIQKFYPIISCCAYHLKNDDIEIQKLIKSFAPDYQFRIIENAERVLIATPIQKEI